MQKTVFIVEDDSAWLRFLEQMLTDRNYRVLTSNTGDGAVEKIAVARPDIAILDIELPGMLGTEICKRLRQIDGLKSLPILLMTGHDTDIYFLAGVQFKATTIFAKDRKLETLLSLIDSLAQDASADDSDEAPSVIGNFCIDPKTQKILLNGMSISVPPKPFAIARLLVQNRPQPLDRHEIMRRLGIRHIGDREIDVFIHTIRKALGASGPRLFRNSRGRGFFFDESGLRLPKTANGNS